MNVSNPSMDKPVPSMNSNRTAFLYLFHTQSYRCLRSVLLWLTLTERMPSRQPSQRPQPIFAHLEIHKLQEALPVNYKTWWILIPLWMCPRCIIELNKYVDTSTFQGFLQACSLLFPKDQVWQRQSMSTALTATRKTPGSATAIWMNERGLVQSYDRFTELFCSVPKAGENLKSLK